MSEDNVFGKIVTGKAVRFAMRSHIKLWFPTYLAEIARVEGHDPAKLPLFRSFVSALDMPEGRYEEHQMPCCVIVAPGLLEEPQRKGGGLITTWAVSVGCVITGQIGRAHV